MPTSSSGAALPSCASMARMDLEERRQVAAAFRRRRAGPDLHRCRRRGPEPAILPRHRELRPAVEPDEDRAADRPRRPHRPKARRAGDQLRAGGHRRASRARGAGREARSGSSKSSASTSSPTCWTPKKVASRSRSCSLRRSSRQRKPSAGPRPWPTRSADGLRKPVRVPDCSMQRSSLTRQRRRKSPTIRCPIGPSG